jgi:hypothetical protein
MHSQLVLITHSSIIKKTMYKTKGSTIIVFYNLYRVLFLLNGLLTIVSRFNAIDITIR